MAVLAAAAFLLALAACPAGAATVPAGFADRPVTTVPLPTALAFTPDGRMLITTHDGLVKVYEDGSLQTTPALDLRSRMCLSDEWGLVGIAVDPAFAINHYVYLYYTFKKYGSCQRDVPESPVNRVSRFVLGDDNSIDPLSETVVVDGIQDPDGIHTGGDLAFGKDGYLYVSTGDGGCDFRGDSGCYADNDAARDLGGLSGKILRVTGDGAIPPDNPYQGIGTTRCSPTGFTDVGTTCQEIYAWGLRNPWRTAFDPNAAGTRFHINDVGLNTWEEIDAGQAGADYGWNVREGPCARDSTTDCGPPPAGMTNPIHHYGHSAGCVSITAGDFVPAGLWPATYDGKYVFGDLVCGKLWTLEPNGSGGYTASEFASGITNLIDGVFKPSGPNAGLYYITWLDYPNDQIRRISYETTNQPPTAAGTASPTYGSVPLTVSFDGRASSDPDGDDLRFDWDFGDGSPHASTATASHSYPTAATYTATLTVSDQLGGEDTKSFRIDAGNHPPLPKIESPLPSDRFAVGQDITLTGSATDPEQGALPDSALSWRVERHHDTHAHPWLAATQGNNVHTDGPAPEDLSSTTNSYLDVFLTATDSQGASATVRQAMNPRLVNVSFETIPPDFDLVVAGSMVTAPLTIDSWEGWRFQVSAPDQAQLGKYWTSGSWSDGGTSVHTFTTPASAAGLTATFKELGYPRPGGASPFRVPLLPEYRPCTSPNTVHKAPLNGPSCTPPSLQSPLLTISPSGRGVGFARFDVVNGDPATPADEADLRIRATATDVESSSGNADFTGSLVLETVLRITDRASGPSQVVPATVQDVRFGVPLNCVATPGHALGGTCNVNTTSDTLLPGFAREGAGAVISAPSVAVLDAGADGTISPASGSCPPTCGSGDESVFLRQGVFAP